jgi:nucleotide-binding universal stress UspA family protein
MTKVQSRKKRRSAAWAEKILVPIDFSPPADAAFRYALELAEKNARILLVHVVAPSEANGVAQARQKLTRYRKSAGLSATRCETLVRAGVTFFEITQAAQEHKADLIILGRSGAAAPNGLDGGHTVERVIRYAKSPILLITDGNSPG